MSLGTKHFYDFENFRVDPDERVLLRDGKPVPLTPKAFQMLMILVENHGHIVDKEKLLSEIWADSFVEEGNLSVNARRLRQALADDANKPKFIETIARRGYRFIAEVQHVEATGAVNGSVRPENTIRFPGSAAPAAESLLPHPKIQSNPLRIVGAAAAPKLELLEEVDQEIKPAVWQRNGVSHLPETTVVGPVRRKRTVLIAASILGLFVIAAIALGNYLLRRDAPASGTRSIAVLPLKPINAANRDELYEMGIADALIIKLSSMKGFVVRPLSATRKYADVVQDPLAAGSEQRVDYVLDSSYQLADGKIRITAQLFNVATGQVEIPYKSEKDAGNIFAMQDAIASEVGNILSARFGTTSSDTTAKRGTNNEEAYRLYLHGMYLTEKYNQKDAERAIEVFDEALKLDPMYAAAWAGKAHAHCNFAHRGGNAPNVEFANAEPALEKALAIDKNNADAYAIRGIINRDYHWNFPEAYKSFDRALELDPNLIIAHRWRGQLLMMDGRHDEAIEEIKKTIDLNPSWIGNHMEYVYALLNARRYDEAIRQADRVREMDRSIAAPYNAHWTAYHLKGDHLRAYENFLQGKKLAGVSEPDITKYETAFRQSGWLGVLRSDRDAMIAKLENDYSPTKFRIASLSAVLGDNEIARKYLNECLDNRLIGLSLIKVHPFLDGLRGDPRFDEIVRRAGL